MPTESPRQLSRPAALLAALWLALASPGAARPQQAEPEAERPRRERRLYEVPRTDAEMSIDARLDEPAWEGALVLRLAVETRPGENVAPPVETECLVTHDDRHLYVAFRAYDPDPKAIRAHLQDRDTIFNDDLVGIKLDTFDDERRAFQLFTNPFGVQMDSVQDDLSQNEDLSWDIIWESFGRVTEEGYVVEMAVPFHQLRFPKTSGRQTWGFDAVRWYPRSQSHRMALQAVDRDVQCQLCQMSRVAGFEGITPGRNVELVPTVTAGRADERQEFPQGGITEGSVASDLGLTARWGITPNLTLNVAANPDFSQVEADVAQLDINERFALFFPERRPFFLEGSDFFRTPLNVVFTRNVADPSWGVKLTGKQGKHAMGVFVAQDELTNLIFPGSQGSSGTSLDLESTAAVARYRRDFGESSALGVLMTSREGGGYANRVAGIDGLYRLGESDALRFQLLSSETEYPLDVAAEFDQPGGSFSDRAFQIRYDHNERNWNLWGRYTDVGADFRADMGFLPQADHTFLLAGGNRVWWGDEDDWYTVIRLGADWDRSEDQSGQMLEEETEIFVNLSGPKQSYLFFGTGQRDRFFDGVAYDNQRFRNSWFEIQPTGDVWFGLFVGQGDAIDFANSRPGEQLFIEPNLRLNLGKRFKATLNHFHHRFDVDGGRLFEANLTQTRLVYQVNVRTFVRAIFQYTDVERTPALYLDEVDPSRERLFSQLLFSYKVNPQTVLFVGYSDTREGDQATDLTQRNRTLFMKFGYAWVL